MFFMGYYDKEMKALEEAASHVLFASFSDDMEKGMNFLEHHQILGAKWGQHNGPPYPLFRGAHSSSEKKAAKAAGVKVGSDSGKGSIENIKKSSGSSKSSVPKQKKELTPEEKREKALAAVRSGDSKKIVKNIDQLSTEELQAANERARLKSELSRNVQTKPVNMKEEMAKQEAIRSGDKEKIKLYADKMTTNELRDALDKVDLTAKLNKVEPQPTIIDKIEKVSKNVGKLTEAAETGIKAYNVIAKVYNSTHKGEAQWPEIYSQKDKQEKKEQTKESKALEALMKQAQSDVKKGVKETKEQQTSKDKSKEDLDRVREEYKAKNKEAFEQAKKRYKDQEDEQDIWLEEREKAQKELDKWTKEQEAKSEKKNKNENSEEKVAKREDSPKSNPAYEEPKSETQQERRYTIARGPKLKKKIEETMTKKMSDFDEDDSDYSKYEKLGQDLLMKDFEESNRVYKENYRTSRNFEALDEQENFYYDVLEMLERG